MYNKIASIILNSAKTASLSDVFVAQPDALKENLAGKIFVLAEIGGKKTDGRKIFDFLVLALKDNYYNDEKILFKDKIEGLKIENIFEAAVAKTNKNLAEFLISEKIKINPAATSLTLGVIYENKLHFANFGRNRALLIYRHNEEYEIINVETDAAPISDNHETSEAVPAQVPKLFSSIISGEIPLNSYFVFTNEALSEYLSGTEMVNIITKLPPITAAEQIKNVLAKINAYVPFLGIVIKNTMGLASQETKEELEEASSAYSSISSLNYTEQKTEQMLAPAGLVNFSKIFKSIRRTLKNWQPLTSAKGRKYPKIEEKTNQASLDLGTVKSLNLARANSFSLKEPIFFKRKPGWPGQWFKNMAKNFLNIFNPQLWLGLRGKMKIWLNNLGQKNRWLFVALGAVVLIFIVSVILTNQQQKRHLAQTNFDNLVAAIEEKENSLDSHLLYNDEIGAAKVLLEAQALISSLPKENKEQQKIYQELSDKLRVNQEKIQKIVKSQALKVNDLSGLGINNLAFADDKIYGASGKFVYILTPNSSSSTRVEIKGANNLSNPFFDQSKNIIYYWDDNAIAQLNVKTKSNSRTAIVGFDPAAGPADYKLYQDKFLYLLAKNNNQIYKYSRTATGFGNKNDWLKEPLDLNATNDFFVIDGDIYILNASGEVLKMYAGTKKKDQFQSAIISPVITSANKLIVGANYIYIFEASSKRLAVLAKKDGHLVNQYEIDSLVNPQDFAVNEAGRAAYFLDNEMVFKVDLNQ